MKHKTMLLLSIPLWILLSLPACISSTPRNAAFRARPDSVNPGDLIGPFSGTVKDSASGDPVAGALVYGTWTYYTPNSSNQPSGFKEIVASTDANGKYRLAQLDRNAVEGTLSNFHLVVYKRGYVAYRSDRRFSDFGPRLDFTQQRNPISLERWQSSFSHARHLRYIGGGVALRALTSWETQEAVAEYNSDMKLASKEDSLQEQDRQIVAAQLLGREEIKSITGFEGSFSSGPLSDTPESNTYSSQHYKAIGQPEMYDVALRVWTLTATSAKKRFEELQNVLPGIQVLDDIADKSFLATEGDIQGYVFLDQKRDIVVFVACGKGLCTEIKHLKRIANKVYSNVQALIPLEKQ